MAPDPSPPPDDVSLLPAFRALHECHAQCERVSGRLIEATGLTPAQFDVIATLGETEGMTCSELGRRTLITKGTLSPVLDRLESKGLVVRKRGEVDARVTYVSLTPAGETVFQQTFYPHVAAIRGMLDKMPPDRQALLAELLAELKGHFAD